MARADVTGERIQLAFANDASGKKFEEFFRRLLEKERALRHVVGTAKIHGPNPSGKGDGGSDGMFVVNDPPRIGLQDFAEPLTWDDIGPTWYSLKNGPHWDALVKRDVGYAEFIVNPSKSRPKKLKPPSDELLRHIASGARYVVVVSTQAGNGSALLDAVAKAFAHWLHEKSLTIPAQLREQLEFMSGNELAAFVRMHAPNLPTEVANALGLTTPDGLQSWTTWSRGFVRKPPDYRVDDVRRQIIETIQSSVPPQIIRVFGPPGVGKTRLVHHALEHADTDLIHYTDVVAVGEDVARSNWIERDAGAITLIVDEVASESARDIARDFSRKAAALARLILIGVSDADAREGESDDGLMVAFHLGALSGEQMRQLVEAEFGESADSAQVGIVLDLSEGYPWFAILLVRGLLEDRDILTRGDDESTRWSAAERVIAGGYASYGGDIKRWRDEVRIRAKCLLVVIMTGHSDVPWSDLWAQRGESLRASICEPDNWKRIQLAHDDCFKREILRRVGRSNRQYVSPANLSRILLNHFFSGPDGLGPRVARHTPELLERLLIQAERFSAAPEVRRRLADCLWTEFERRVAEREPLDAFLNQTRGLGIATEMMPEVGGRAVARAIRSFSTSQLAQAKKLRHGLRATFERLVQLPISAATFEHVEDALFQMARVEDERWANNATGIWKSLALVWLSQTYQPWALRFGLLRRRCQTGLTQERRLALEGLAVAVTTREVGLGHSQGEYEWQIPDVGAGHMSKGEAWSLLISLCDDSEPEVAARARAIVAEQLRGAVREGVGIDAARLHAIIGTVANWTPDQRKELAQTLVDIRLYDLDRLEATLLMPIDLLTRALKPTDFVEKLVQQVGSWHPGPWAIDDEQREAHEIATDESIAKEAIANPQLLIEQFDWLSSGDAKRRPTFLRVLGRVDAERLFLSPLETYTAQHIDDHAWLLPCYIEGWAHAGDTENLDAWLFAQFNGGEHLHAAAVALPFLEPSARRFRWLIDLVVNGQAESTVAPGVYRHWASAALAEFGCDLIEAMEQHQPLVPAAMSLANKLLDEPLEGGIRERVLRTSSRLLRSTIGEHMLSVHEFDWQRLVKKLVLAGHVDDAVDAIALLASRDTHGDLSLVDRVVRVLIDAGQATKLWNAVASMLGSEYPSPFAWRLAGTGLISAVEPDLVLAWVGNDEQRAATVAEMQRPYDAELSELARQLLVRFGGAGLFGCELSARVFSTPHAVQSLTEWKRRQLEHATNWAKGEAPAVRRWALDIAADLRRSIAEAETQAEFRRKYG